MSGPRLLWMHENFVSAKQGGNSRASQSLAAMLDAGWQIDLVCTTRSYLGEDYGTGEAGIEREGGLTIHRLEAAPGTTRASQYIRFCSAALRYAGTLRQRSLHLAHRQQFLEPDHAQVDVLIQRGQLFVLELGFQAQLVISGLSLGLEVLPNTLPE
jgi:hypothetical protein